MHSIKNIRVIPASTIIRDPERAPHQGGVYAALFPNGEELLEGWDYAWAPGEERVTVAGMPLLYVGATASIGLSMRLRTHMRRDCRSSTLRWTLASLLDLQDPFVGTESMRANSIRLADEDRLTTWMAKEIVFAFATHDDPRKAETELIKTISCPLNINQRGFHGFARVLSEEPSTMKYPLIELCAVMGDKGVERRSPWVSDEWLGAEIARDPWLFREVEFEAGYFDLPSDAEPLLWPIPASTAEEMGRQLTASYR